MLPSPMTIPARRAVVGARVAQDRLHLAPAAQVLGEVVPIVTESAEVDHLAQPGAGRGGGEGGRTFPVPDGEVLDVQGVDQVVGGVLAVQGLAQALRVADVGVHRPPGARVVVGMACQRRHVVAIVRQRLGEGSADEPGRPRHGNPHRAPSESRVCGRHVDTTIDRTQGVRAGTLDRKPAQAEHGPQGCGNWTRKE